MQVPFHDVVHPSDAIGKPQNLLTALTSRLLTDAPPVPVTVIVTRNVQVLCPVLYDVFEIDVETRRGAAVVVGAGSVVVGACVVGGVVVVGVVVAGGVVVVGGAVDGGAVIVVVLACCWRLPFSS